MRTRLIPEAEADVVEAYGWYKERSVGLGTAFRSSIDEALEAIGRHPLSFPVVHKDMRRALVAKFPYGLFFVPFPGEIVVFACFHASRDPKAWKRRKS